jgi:hypothetical protein
LPPSKTFCSCVCIEVVSGEIQNHPDSELLAGSACFGRTFFSTRAGCREGTLIELDVGKYYVMLDAARKSFERDS